jgi:hypothetical protein
VVALTGPDPSGALPRTRVAPPGYGAPTSQFDGTAQPGAAEHDPLYHDSLYGDSQYQGPQYRDPQYRDPQYEARAYPRGAAAEPGAIVPPRRPSTPAGGRPGSRDVAGPARAGLPPRAGGRRRGGGSRVGLWLTVVLLVLGALAITLIALNPGDSGEPGSAVPPSSTPAPTPSGTNSRVYTDGSLQFQVQSLHCGVQKIGLLITHKPDGQYCLVKINVRDVGTSDRTLVANQQYMFDRNGGQHEAYSALTSRLYFPLESLWNKISPGGQVNGTLIFDIPANTSPTRLELHDGLLGHGVQIPLER